MSQITHNSPMDHRWSANHWLENTGLYALMMSHSYVVHEQWLVLLVVRTIAMEAGEEETGHMPRVSHFAGARVFCKQIISKYIVSQW